MKTEKQTLGFFGEKLVTENCTCPNCTDSKKFSTLKNNFKCADLECVSCGKLVQVKTMRSTNIDNLPRRILGAAWRPQKTLLEKGHCYPLYLVLMEKKIELRIAKYAIYYLPAECQPHELFVVRKPLSINARRAGWQGFIYNLQEVDGCFVRLA